MDSPERMIIELKRTGRNNWLRVYLPAGVPNQPINASILGKNGETIREFVLSPGNNLIDISQMDMDGMMLKVENKTMTLVKEIN